MTHRKQKEGNTVLVFFYNGFEPRTFRKSIGFHECKAFSAENDKTYKLRASLQEGGVHT
jgi:hypothetical protein